MAQASESVLRAENEELRLRLEEAEQALEAIRTGQVEALVVEGPDGPRIFTLEGATQSYRVLVESMNEGAVTSTEDGIVLYCNARFAEMLGEPLQSVIGSSLRDHVPEPFRVGFDELLDRARESAAAREELPLLASDGGEVPAYLSVGSIVDDGRRVLCLVATDLREQKRTEAIAAAERTARETAERLQRTLAQRERAEASLRRREAQLRALVEDLHSGVAFVDASGMFSLYNRRFLEMFGLAAGADVKNVNDQDWSTWQVFGEDGRLLPVDEHPVRKAVLTRRAVRDQLVGVRLPSGGDLLWMLVTAEPLLAADGRIEHVVCTYHDVTHRRRAEDALREANEKLVDADARKDEFLGMLSHELRNPLAPIRNSSYILRHVQPGSEQAERAQTVIERQTQHLTRLVDDLLDVTRIARGKIELRRVRADLRDVVRRTAEDLRSIVESRGVALRVEVPPSPVFTQIDVTRVAQAIGNLLHNAAKFTRHGDSVTLSLASDDASARIRVEDTGAGIDAQLLPRIFTAFVQGERTLARSDGGLGLGLALVKGIVELHGGAASAESAGVGQGARFTLLLPLARPALPEERSPAASSRASWGRRVLVVDDNVDAAASLAESLKIAGHEVDVAFDGPTAIEKVRTSSPDVVLCDIGLPGMSGYEVARRLRASGANGVQLIAVSGYAQPEDVRKAVEAGFDAHVAKPCDPETIERLLT
ncbi:MAG TPA: PAS domain S-box protein [Anaeromyxobacter sp.]|nr:PAS domain S-box protein [Anaeromyxobacter sp.]